MEGTRLWPQKDLVPIFLLSPESCATWSNLLTLSVLLFPHPFNEGNNTLKGDCEDSMSWYMPRAQIHSPWVLGPREQRRMNEEAPCGTVC